MPSTSAPDEEVAPAQKPLYIVWSMTMWASASKCVVPWVARSMPSSV